MDQLTITLRAARVNCGLTLEDVAAITKKSKDTIQKYEKDSTNIPRDLMVTLIGLYSVNVDNLFFGLESDFIGSNKTKEQARV